MVNDARQIGRVPQPHIQALCADWRQHVRRFADKRDPFGCKAIGLFDGQRKDVAAGRDSHATKNGMRLALDGFTEIFVGHGLQAFRLIRLHHPNHAGAIPGQWYEHAWTGLGVEFRRYVVVRARVRDVQRQRRLIEGTPLHADTGRFSAERMAAIRTHNKGSRQ